MPGWLAAVGRTLPLTHGIEAAQTLVAAGPASTVAVLVVQQAAVGLGYAAFGVALLRLYEWQGRRHAALELT